MRPSANLINFLIEPDNSLDLCFQNCRVETRLKGNMPAVQLPLRVKSYRQRHLRSRSEAGVKPDVIGTNPDIGIHAAWLADCNWPTLSRIGSAWPALGHGQAPRRGGQVLSRAGGVRGHVMSVHAGNIVFGIL